MTLVNISNLPQTVPTSTNQPVIADSVPRYYAFTKLIIAKGKIYSPQAYSAIVNNARAASQKVTHLKDQTNLKQGLLFKRVRSFPSLFEPSAKRHRIEGVIDTTTINTLSALCDQLEKHDVNQAANTLNSLRHRYTEHENRKIQQEDAANTLVACSASYKKRRHPNLLRLAFIASLFPRLREPVAVTQPAKSEQYLVLHEVTNLDATPSHSNRVPEERMDTADQAVPGPQNKEDTSPIKTRIRIKTPSVKKTSTRHLRF